MKSHNNLLVGTALAASLAFNAACGAPDENWAEEPEVTCSEFAVNNEDLTVQSLAKAIRGCYDTVPDELRGSGESNSIHVRIPTRDGKMVRFDVLSHAKVDSDIATYAREAVVVGMRNYPINIDPSVSRTEPSSWVQINAYPSDVFAQWHGRRDAVDPKTYRMTAGPDDRRLKGSSVNVSPQIPGDTASYSGEMRSGRN